MIPHAMPFPLARATRGRDPVAPANLAEAVTAARTEAGMSQRDLARLIGASNNTISGIERGADPHWATLAALLEALPALAADDVLPNPAGHPPPALAAAWRTHRDVLGFECERAIVTVEAGAESRLKLVLGAVRLTERRPFDAVGLTCLMKIVCAGSAATKALLDGKSLIARGTQVVEAGEVEHHFEIVEPSTSAFVYRASGGRADIVQLLQGVDPVAAATFTVRYPVRELRLAIGSTRRAEWSRAAAWLPAAGSEPTASTLLRRLHPSRKPRRRVEGRRHRLELTVPWPPVGVAYAMSCDRLAPKVAAPRRAGEGMLTKEIRNFDDVAQRLGAARRAAALSQRHLAKDLGIAFNTISTLESGTGGKASTLGRYLLRFRDLAPQDLLPQPEVERWPDVDALWRYHARLRGFVAERNSKSAQVLRDGRAQVRIRTDGLRAIGRHDEPLKLRLLMQRAITSQQPLPAIATRASKRMKRRIVHREGTSEWQLVFPRDLAAKGTSYQRTYVTPPMYHLSATDAARDLGPVSPYLEGLVLPMLHATELLVIEAVFPRRFVLDRAGFAAWPESFPPNPLEGEPINVLGSFVHETEIDPEKGVLRLQLKRPLPGLNYVVWWQVPD
jgi:transcriptional regulator with XRE-family HTH domain